MVQDFGVLHQQYMSRFDKSVPIRPTDAPLSLLLFYVPIFSHCVGD